MVWHRIAFSGFLLAAIAGAQTLNCDFQGYKALDGLKAEMRSGALELSWEGERGQTLRAILAVNGGQPVVRELAVRRNGKWSVLGHDLTPEYQVTTGRRRISAQQEVPLRALGMFTPEIIERQKWFAFWDAPLNVPGRAVPTRPSICPANPKRSSAPGLRFKSPAARSIPMAAAWKPTSPASRSASSRAACATPFTTAPTCFARR